MTTTSVSIVQASAADSTAIWQWRNDPHTRAMSLSNAEVPWDTHSAWFAAALANPNRLLFIGRIDGVTEAVGMCRFDIDGNAGSAEVSINLNPAMRGRGLARPLLIGAIADFQAMHPMPLTATIKAVNLSSIRAFAGCGFVLDHVDDEAGHYRL